MRHSDHRHLRIARPVSNLHLSSGMYCSGLGWTIIGRFENHDGFDGIMLGPVGMPYHFEFTQCRTHVVKPAPTPEDLLVTYVEERTEWQHACERMIAAGFLEVGAFNPYWDAHGRTFQDPDGYRVVLNRGKWT